MISLFFLINIVLIYKTQAYRHGIFLENIPLCNNLNCEGNLPHTACRKFQPNARCEGFEILQTSRKEIRTLVLGHNGIRNKIAMEWKIGNMNILHWSRDLEKLSKQFLIECKVKKDVCNFLVNKDITIGQNIFFSKTAPGSKWLGKTVRYWYSEIGFNIKNWEQYMVANRKNASQMSQFTQMIWPTSEFIGCGAARMFGGYMATCYYHPASSENFNDFAYNNKGCAKCSGDRLTCSRFFHNLCGLDLDYSFGNSLNKSSMLKWIVLMMLSIHILRYFKLLLL